MKPDIQKFFRGKLYSKAISLLDSNFEAINDIIEKKFNEMR